MPFFTLWCAVTGEFDSDWHRTAERAEQHRIECHLGDDWRVTQLTAEQQAQVYAV